MDIDGKIVIGIVLLLALVLGFFGTAPQSILSQSDIQDTAGNSYIRLNQIVNGPESYVLSKGTTYTDSQGTQKVIQKQIEIRVTPVSADYIAGVAQGSPFSNQPSQQMRTCVQPFGCLIGGNNIGSTGLRAIKFQQGQVNVAYDVQVYKDGSPDGPATRVQYPLVQSIQLANGNVNFQNVQLGTTQGSVPEIATTIAFIDDLNPNARYEPTTDTGIYSNYQHFTGTPDLFYRCGNGQGDTPDKLLKSCQDEIRQTQIQPGNNAPLGVQHPNAGMPFNYSPTQGNWRLAQGSWNAQVIVTIDKKYADIVQLANNFAKPVILSQRGNGQAGVGNTAQLCWTVKNNGDAGAVTADFSSSTTSITSGYAHQVVSFSAGDSKEICAYVIASTAQDGTLDAKFCGMNSISGEQSCTTASAGFHFTQQCTGSACGTVLPNPAPAPDCSKLGPLWNYDANSGQCINTQGQGIPSWVYIGLAIIAALIIGGFALKK